MHIEDASVGEDLKSLEEAQNSPDWPKWQEAISTELRQLAQKGTWTLTEGPKDAVPIANKWVFIRKYNKDRNLTKYKVRLVMKGCAQQLGQDYTETFSLVVRMETIRVILSLAAIKKLVICQMDIKGTYLNGTLKETVYMRQLTGYEDDTGHICQLIKMLYGLKQSGREWNKELDNKLKKHDFNKLRSDPCTYIRHKGDDPEIITVWVDDFLLFATMEDLMRKMKKDIESEWETTDLGEPQK
jgi:hypothetical protein